MDFHLRHLEWLHDCMPSNRHTNRLNEHTQIGVQTANSCAPKHYIWIKNTIADGLMAVTTHYAVPHIFRITTKWLWTAWVIVQSFALGANRIVVLWNGCCWVYSSMKWIVNFFRWWNVNSVDTKQWNSLPKHSFVVRWFPCNKLLPQNWNNKITIIHSPEQRKSTQNVKWQFSIRTTNDFVNGTQCKAMENQFLPKQNRFWNNNSEANWEYAARQRNVLCVDDTRRLPCQQENGTRVTGKSIQDGEIVVRFYCAAVYAVFVYRLCSLTDRHMHTLTHASFSCCSFS